MVRDVPWLRRLGAVLAALVLAVLAFGPSLDALLCHDDADLGAVAAEMPAFGAEPGDQGPGEHAGGRAACVHGHCHHGAAHTPALSAPDASRADAGAAGLGTPRTRIPTSDLKFRLIRPPRA